MLSQTVINGSSMIYRTSLGCQAAPAYQRTDLGIGWAAGMMETLES